LAKRLILSCLFFLLGVFHAYAQIDIPKPEGFVNDFANVLNEQTEESLRQTLLILQQSTSVEVAVLTVNSLQGRTIEDYSITVAREWGIGTKEEDNGLLILVAPHERETRIEVGYGLEGYVTDAQSGWIIRNQMLPAFKEGDYDTGVLLAVEKIRMAVEGIEEIPGKNLFGDIPLSMDIVLYLPFFFFAFVLPWFAAIFGRSKRWWPGGLVGAGLGGVAWIAWSVTAWGILGLGIFGLVLDYFVSKHYKAGSTAWWIGGGRGGRGGGGFGGFSGGGFGGGGGSGSW
jgi:uncharacterized protein